MSSANRLNKKQPTT